MANLQDRLYQYLFQYLTENQSSPSYRDMTEALHISPKSKSLITRTLQSLRQKEKIFLKKEGRKIQISLVKNDFVSLLNQTIDIQKLLMTEKNFLLPIKDNQLIEEGIYAGDFLICQSTHMPNEGDKVVVMIDQTKMQLKKISYQIKGMITLIPMQDDVKPKAYTPERVNIQGVYIGLLRLE